MSRILIAGLGAALAFAPLAACNRGQAAAASATSGASAEAAAAWMKENGAKPGVVTTPSGLQYKIVTSGPATGVHPRKQDEVKVHYEGSVAATGAVFDSSFQRGTPEVFQLGQLVPGWIEGIALMRPGDEWMLYVPPQLGYGPNATGPIPANSVLVFRIQLLDVLPAAGPA